MRNLCLRMIFMKFEIRKQLELEFHATTRTLPVVEMWKELSGSIARETSFWKIVSFVNIWTASWTHLTLVRLERCDFFVIIIISIIRESASTWYLLHHSSFHDVNKPFHFRLVTWRHFQLVLDQQLISAVQGKFKCVNQRRIKIAIPIIIHIDYINDNGREKCWERLHNFLQLFTKLDSLAIFSIVWKLLRTSLTQIIYSFTQAFVFIANSSLKLMPSTDRERDDAMD